MGTSYVNQIPVIVHVVQQLRPRRILDVGKGFGKYGMLLHEYVGLDPAARIDPARKLREQSRISIDAVEVDPDLMLPHLDHAYDRIHRGAIEELYRDLPRYDLVLMADVIEHVDKPAGVEVLRHFVASGAVVVVSTPIAFFRQSLHQSRHEEHVSHWTERDFRALGRVSTQYVGPGAVYVLTRQECRVPGFGRGVTTRLRRLLRLLRDDWGRW